jgi:hypothetical protein
MTENIATRKRPALPAPVTASVWILAALGSAALLTNGPTLVMLAGMSGMVTPRTALPAMTLYSVAVVAGIVDIACAVALHRGRRWPRLVVTLVPPVGIALMGAAMALGLADSARGSFGPVSVWMMVQGALATLLMQGLTVILVLIPVGLLWSRGARAHFAASPQDHPAEPAA